MIIAVACIVGFSAGATVYTVNNTADGSGLNQLRGALSNAALSVGPHTVNIAAGTYTLTLGPILFGNLLNQNITHVGADSSTTVIYMTATM